MAGNNEEQVKAAHEVLKRTQKYTGLAANPLFQDWRRDVVEATLKAWQDEVMSLSADTPDAVSKIQANVLAYQKVRYMVNDVFVKMENIEKQARKVIKGS